MHEFNDWLSSTALSQVIQVTSWAIPAIQTVHIVCLAGLFGAAAMLDLRVLGAVFRPEPVSVVSRRHLPLVWPLLGLLVLSGSLLILAEPARTLGNPVFYVKMALLAAAVTVTLLLQSGTRAAEQVGGGQKVLALLSLGLWSGIIIAGRYIAYVEVY